MRRNNQQQGGGRYDNRGGGEGGYNRDRDRDRNRDQPRRGDRGGRGGGPREPPVFGIVISMKEVFGFLQPLLPSQVPGEEHLYFNEKDIVGERLQEGDEVQYVVRSGPRGPVAAQVRRLEGGVKVKKPKVIGIVEKEAEQYKFFPGLISVANYPQFTADGAEVEASEGTAAISHSVPFMPVDVSKGSRRLMKGDEVEFDLYVIPMAAQKGQNQTAGYCRCHSIKLVRSRNDRLIAEQVKELENSGVAREQGVIDTIKNDFGFLRPADRQEQIFFRLEDVLDSKEHLPNEGDEVEFYVISETVKGRTAERAVHLKFLPHGTVQFEETLGTGMRAVVVTEPRLHPREEPGLMRLCQPLIVTGSEAPIETVELWSRCLPEGFGLMRCGDELEIDVTKYRPEKLIFARNAKVCSYLSLGRAFGSVCDVKAAGGYGFIRSAQGDPDCYFRTAEVLGDSGVLIPDKRVKVGQLVSYEILQETSRGGSTRMKAMRVQICSEDNFRHRKATLQKEVHGTIVREARKGDHHAVGSIELSEELVDTQIPCYDVFTSHQDLYCALQDFRDNVHLKEVTVRHFLPYQRYALHMLLRHHFTGIAHATVDGMKRGKAAAETESEVQVLSLTEDNLNAVTNSVATASAAANANVDVSLTENNSSPSKKKGKKSSLDDDDAVPQEIRIWKIEDPAEFAVWSKANDVLLQGPSRYDGKKNNIVSFQKADLVDSLSGGGGGARAGSDVTFDVCVDRVTGARVAANVKVSDVQAEGGEWPQLGCLEYFRADGDMHGGYIRSVPSDEKLMWNQLVRSTDENDDVAADSHSRQEWKLGSIVSFEIRVRGGIRYAAGVAIVPPESDLAPQKEVELDGVVRGVIVESPATKGGVTESGPGTLSVYIVDTSECPSMTNKIVDLAGAVQVVKNKKLVNGVGTFSASDSASWEKKQIDDADKEKETKEEEKGKESDVKSKKDKSVPGGRDKVQSCPQKHSYPPLSMAVVPLGANETTSGLVVGSMVQCRLVANWFQQRLPLFACGLTVLSTAETAIPKVTESELATQSSLANMVIAAEDTSPAGRVRGTIIRLKINSTLGFDVSEITINDQYRKVVSTGDSESGGLFGNSGSGTGDDNLFYCDTRDLRSEGSGGRDKSAPTAHVGDVVEFVPVPGICIAACPTVVKGSSRVGQAPVPSSGRRNVFNSSLQGGPTAGVKSITMAEGPQGESIGFPAGWRGTVDVSSLPWGHLLGHLAVTEPEAIAEEVS